MTDRKLALDPYKHHLDWYDHMFDARKAGVPVWKRNTRDDFPTRSAQFELLKSGPFKVPMHGVKGRGITLTPDAEVVAYTDETMHQGLGKERMPFGQVPEGMLWAMYLTPPEGRGSSIRYLRIGSRWFLTLAYRSDDWRSNCMTTDVRVAGVLELSGALRRTEIQTWMYEQMKAWKSPLLAVDLTESAGMYFATDFNLAPGFEACIRDHLTPTQVVDAIKKFYFRHCAP